MLLDHYLKKHDAAGKQIQHGERHRGCVPASVGTDTATQQEVLMEQKEPLFGKSYSGLKASLHDPQKRPLDLLLIF